MADETKEWTNVKTRKGGFNKKKVNPVSTEVNHNVAKQEEAVKKVGFSYATTNTGALTNSNTLYVESAAAHYHQIVEVFDKAIKKAKSMPEIFGSDFEADVVVDHVKNRDGSYEGWSLVDLSNQKLYWALLGYNVDGSRRGHSIDDPNWVPPIYEEEDLSETEEEKPVFKWDMDQSSTVWADEEEKPVAPKIWVEEQPILTLDQFEFDEQQKELAQYIKEGITHGILRISPALFIQNISPQDHPKMLWAGWVPNDLNFLYEIFSRWARTKSSDNKRYPRIMLRWSKSNESEEDNKKWYALVEYASEEDTTVAFNLMRKLKLKYFDKEMTITVKRAKLNNKN